MKIKSCRFYNLCSVPFVAWLWSPKSPRVKVSAPGGAVTILPDRSYRKMIMSQSFQNCRLYAGNWLLMYCTCLYKSCLCSMSNSKMLPLQGWAGQLNPIFISGILTTAAASFKKHVYSCVLYASVCSSLNVNKQNTVFPKSW